MATKDVSGRTARRLRLTLAKRIADSSELNYDSKCYCMHDIDCNISQGDSANISKYGRADDAHNSFSDERIEDSDDSVSSSTTLESANGEDTEQEDTRMFENLATDGNIQYSIGDETLNSDFGMDDDVYVEDGNLQSLDVEDPRIFGSSHVHMFNNSVAESAEQCSRVALYEGSQIAEEDAIVALLSLAGRHRLTYACIGDILQLTSSLLPMPNGFNVSLHRLLGRFAKFSSETLTHKFCGNCSVPLYDRSKCTKPKCLSVRQPDATFIEIPLQKQIAEKMQDEKFYRMIQYRFVRDSTVGEIQDVYDGRLYQDAHDFFSCPYNLSLTMNYDGAPKFRSSGMQVWPVQFIVNELPPQISISSRNAKEHILTGGVWCSCQKPSTEAFLKPVMETIKDLETQGVKVRIGENDVFCRVKLLMVVADLPAKAAVLNCNQYNGKFGCSTCDHEGKQVKKGRGSTRVYPYNKNARIRCSSDIAKYADEAIKTKKTVCGVKGESILKILPSFDVVKSVPVDYMHCVLLGLVRKLLSLWFDKKKGNSKNEWYIGSRITEVDKRLVAVAPPRSVERAPRSIDKHRQYWKAQECRNFLLYYVPATLSGILPDKYFVHTLLLTKSLRILLGMHITHNDLRVATEFIDLYVMLYEEYYGQKHCIPNLHLLTHLTMYVKLCGPLWAHSAFGFESFMGVLLQQTHSTHDIGNQMVTHLLLQKRIKPLRDQARQSKDCPVFLKAYLDSFDNSLDCCNEESHFVTGKETTIALVDTELRAVNDYLITNNKLPLTSKFVVSYSKVVVNGQTIQSQSMSRAKRSNSYTLAYCHGGSEVSYGLLKRLIHVRSGERNLALIQTLDVIRRTLFPSHHNLTSAIVSRLFEDFVNVKETGILRVIDVDNVIMQCFNTSITCNCTQLTHFVNSIERIL